MPLHDFSARSLSGIEFPFVKAIGFAAAFVAVIIICRLCYEFGTFEGTKRTVGSIQAHVFAGRIADDIAAAWEAKHDARKTPESVE